MTTRHWTLILLPAWLAACALAAAPVRAAIDDATLPADTAWYVHVDLETMRGTEVGRRLYTWFEGEVLDDVKRDTGFDADKELDAITAYSDATGAAALVLRGDVSQASRDKLLAALAANGELATGSADGNDYYRVDDIDLKDNDMNLSGDTLFVSFARRGSVVAATTLDGMQRALDAQPRRSNGKALLVLAADRSLMQAGVDTVAMGGQGWNSGLLREAREVAFVLADRDGDADIAVRVTADNPRTTDSLAAIVRGLVGLQALADDQEPEVTAVLSALKIDADSAGLTLALRVAPELLLGIID